MKFGAAVRKQLRTIGAGKRRAERKLDFIGVGAMKAGTSSLHHQLSRHPHIELFKGKELQYFERDSLFAGDHRPLAGDYGAVQQNFFFDRQVTGEITPVYLYWRPALERIKAYNPKAKILILLRNPVHRAYSQWGHFVRKSRALQDTPPKPESFRQWMKEEIASARAAPDYQHRRLSCIGRSRYGEQIRRVKMLFPPEQIFFVKSEDFFGNQLKVTDAICCFLGVAPLSTLGHTAVSHRNVGTVAPMDEGDWEMAYEHLNIEIDAVEKELGWDCSDWRSQVLPRANSDTERNLNVAIFKS